MYRVFEDFDVVLRLSLRRGAVGRGKGRGFVEGTLGFDAVIRGRLDSSDVSVNDTCICLVNCCFVNVLPVGAAVEGSPGIQRSCKKLLRYTDIKIFSFVISIFFQNEVVNSPVFLRSVSKSGGVAFRVDLVVGELSGDGDLVVGGEDAELVVFGGTGGRVSVRSPRMVLLVVLQVVGVTRWR